MIAASGIQCALDHIARAYKSSETRTPLIVSALDGNPGASIDFLARQQNSRVWSITMDGAGSEQNALDYVEVGVHNGDWVLLQQAEKCTAETMRKIGLLLMTLKPDPKNCPRREFFRLWLQVSDHINVNDHVHPLFPQVIMKNCIVCRVKPHGSSDSPASTPVKGGDTTSSAAASPSNNSNNNNAASPVAAAADTQSPSRGIAAPSSSSASPTKMTKRMAAEPPLLGTEIIKHNQRRTQGRESDSESDTEDADKKITGLWFHRNVEFYSNDSAATVADFKKMIFEEVDNNNVQKIQEIVSSGHVDIDKVKRDGMTPLQFAVSREREAAVKALIDAGADVTIRRESDGSPLLFMAIENPVILQHLIDGHVDMKQKYEGHLLEDHPLTAPNIAKLVRQMRRDGKI